MAVQGDDFVTGCLLSYPYFKEHYYMIAIDLSKHQALDADPKCYKKLFLLQIYSNMKIQQCFSFLKK